MTDRQISKRNEWIKFFSDFESSGLTVANFCQERGVSVPTFYHRKRALSATRDEAHTKPVFVKIEPIPDREKIVCRVRLAGLEIDCFEWPAISWLVKSTKIRVCES